MFIFKVSIDEIDKMISTVDRNGDGRISYSEFRFQSHPEKNAKSILNIAKGTTDPRVEFCLPK